MITLPPPINNRVLFLDMNAFFAACEQWKSPALRGRPVGVTPTLADTGCVIAASYEAKRLGVTTGCTVGDAKQKIPSITIVKAVPKDYVAVHNTIASFLERSIAPNINRLSIDEFAVFLDKKERLTPNAHAVARRIKDFLRCQFDGAITGSIGIGPNTFLAKLATDIEKPDGLAMVQTHTIGAALKQFALTDLPGINTAMERRLHALGVKSPSDFARLPLPTLKLAFGINGVAWWHALRGYSIGSVLPGSAFGAPRPAKSVGHSHVLAPRLRTKAGARAVIFKLWIKVADRLRAKSLGAKVVAMGAIGRFDRWSASVSVTPTQDVFGVWRAIQTSYDDLPETFAPIRAYAVVVDLAPHDPWQPKIVADREAKVASAFEAVQNLNDRYGRWTLKPASMLIAGDSAPNRIAYHAPDYEMD